MGNGGTPTLNDLMSMIDLAEESIEAAADEINKTTERMLKKGNGHDSCGLVKTHEVPRDEGLMARVRRKINGVK